MNLTINQSEVKTNFTGYGDGEDPIKVYRKAIFTVVHVGEEVTDSFFKTEFREVKFVDQANGNIMINTLYAGHYPKLESELQVGEAVSLEYEVGSNWIKSINGKRWN